MAADNKANSDKSTASNETNSIYDAQSSDIKDQISQGGMSEKTIGRLKFVSGLMGVLIILCLVLLVYGVSQKAGELSSVEGDSNTIPAAISFTEAPASLPDSLILPVGMKVQTIAPALHGGLWLFSEQDGSQYLLRIDGFGQLVQQINIATQN